MQLSLEVEDRYLVVTAFHQVLFDRDGMSDVDVVVKFFGGQQLQLLLKQTLRYYGQQFAPT